MLPTGEKREESAWSRSASLAESAVSMTGRGATCTEMLLSTARHTLKRIAASANSQVQPAPVHRFTRSRLGQSAFL
jgi:hypothetical protein